MNIKLSVEAVKKTENIPCSYTNFPYSRCTIDSTWLSMVPHLHTQTSPNIFFNQYCLCPHRTKCPMIPNLITPQKQLSQQNHTNHSLFRTIEQQSSTSLSQELFFILQVKQHQKSTFFKKGAKSICLPNREQIPGPHHFTVEIADTAKADRVGVLRSLHRGGGFSEQRYRGDSRLDKMVLWRSHDGL